MTSTNSFQPTDLRLYYITPSFVEYRPSKNQPTVAQKRAQSKATQQEFLRRKGK